MSELSLFDRSALLETEGSDVPPGMTGALSISESITPPDEENRPVSAQGEQKGIAAIAKEAVLFLFKKNFLI